MSLCIKFYLNYWLITFHSNNIYFLFRELTYLLIVLFSYFLSIRLLIEHDARVEVKDDEGTTPLHAALSTNWNGGKSRLQLAFIRLLIKAPKNKKLFVNAGDSFKRTALHLAFEHFKYIPLPAIVKLLIENGADVDVFCVKSKTSQTPLHLACSKVLNEQKIQEAYKKAADELVKNGADINLKDSCMNSPLHLAADSKNSYIAEYLIDLKGFR